jgi:hypothetical protein
VSDGWRKVLPKETKDRIRLASGLWAAFAFGWLWGKGVKRPARMMKARCGWKGLAGRTWQEGWRGEEREVKRTVLWTKIHRWEWNMTP